MSAIREIFTEQKRKKGLEAAVIEEFKIIKKIIYILCFDPGHAYFCLLYTSRCV